MPDGRPPLDLAGRLRALDAAGLRRRPRAAAPGRVDLSSNDYLGLSADPTVHRALIRGLSDGLPHGGTGSRLLTGEHPAWRELEARFARWQGRPAALAFATGFAANTGLLGALVQPGDLVVSDAANHASLIDGLRAVRGTERAIVPHRDLDAVEAALAAHPHRRAFVVVESVYSMDGTRPDLAALAARCAGHGAHLIVDEAHATGLYGPSGQGAVAAAGLQDQVLATIHTAGKSLGLAGAVVCGSADLVDWLVQRARSFVFSTAPPPFLAAGLHAALDRLQDDPDLRHRPHRLAARLRAALGPAVDTGPGDAPIVPVIVGSPARALALQDHLAHRGWDARAIRPPTVPEGTCRLRLVIRAVLAEAQVDALATDVLDGLSTLDG